MVGGSFASMYVAALFFLLLTVACTGGGEPATPTATSPVDETASPALTLVPPPTRTPSPTPTPTAVAPNPLEEMSAAQIYEKVSPSVAFVKTSTGTGTGFLIEGGYVVTNDHVVWPWEEARVVFPDGPEIVAPVAAWDPMSDVALLGPVEAPVPPLELGDGEDLPIGSEVFLLGYPGESELSPTPTILSGILSHFRQWDSLGMTYLQTDVAVAGGQSGGPLLNSKGEVIGITTFRFTEANYALAASVSDLEPVLQQLIQGRDPSGVSNRSLWKGRPGKEFDGGLRNPWDSKLFLFDLTAGDSVEIEIACEKQVRFNVTDLGGNVLLDVDNGFGGMEQGSAVALMDGHHFLTVHTPAHSSACFELSADVPMVPFSDPDDGRRLKLPETIAGNIDYPGDRDWYSILLEEGELVRISADSLNMDTILHVDFPGSSVNQVLQDDDSGGGLFDTNSELVYRAPATGEYLVVVEGYSGWDVWNRGGYFLSVDRAPPGTEAATVPPDREEVDSPFGKMMIFESQLSDFSVQVPAGWVEASIDEDNPDLTFSATNVGAKEKEIGFVGILEFDLAESDERQTLGELADSLVDGFSEKGIATRREKISTLSGDPGVVLEFRQELEPDQFTSVWMMAAIQEERYAFVLFYIFPEGESQSRGALIEYSFSTVDSSGEGKWYKGRWLHVNVVSMERLQELRYSTIDPNNVVRRWSLFPSGPGNELLLVRLKVENHTVDRISVDTDGTAAELRNMTGTAYLPVSISETVWQDFHGEAEALVRVARGQCFDGMRALIEPGTTVRWRSEDDTAQILAFEDDSITIGPNGSVELAPGKAVSHAFHQPGTYQYFCGYPNGVEWPAEVRVMPPADRSDEAVRSVLFLESSFELLKGFGLDGYMVFDVPSETEFSSLRWLAGDSVTIPELPRALDFPEMGKAAGPADREILAALYSATDGRNWQNNNGWMSDRPVGEWYGVVTNASGRVAGLHLSDNRLSGEIPSELGSLTGLTVLFLNGNDLTGNIPPELGDLAGLEILHLQFNNFTGEIPPELSGLANLRELDLGVNGLDGEIPPELGTLGNLTSLWLGWNDLSGEIPAELGGLSKLTRLWVNNNRLEGCIPDSLADQLDDQSNTGDLRNCGHMPSGTSGREDAGDSRAATLPDADLLAYAARHAGGPGAVYVGDLNQLAGPAPSRQLGYPDGNVPLESLERHLWIYESPFYQELLEKAKLTDPTPMTYDGEAITIQHVCINRALLPCVLLETYLAPNLRGRTNGKVEIITTSFPELGLAGPDTLSLIADGTLDSVTVYGGYVGGDIPGIEIQNLWGVYTSREQEFEATQAIIGDIEDLVLAETGGVVMNHSWYAGFDQLLFCREKIDTLDDFEDKRIRSNSTVLSDWLYGMGATPRFVAFAEVYEQLDRGTLDCGMTGADQAYGQRWYEDTDYIIGPLFSFPSANNVINAGKWASIPDDLRQIILEEGAKSELEALRLASIQNETGLSNNQDAGLEFVPFSAEMRRRSFEAGTDHVIPRWLRRLGYPREGQDIVDLFNRKAGPVAGLRIESDGSVVRVSPQDFHERVSGVEEREPTAPPVSQSLLEQVAGQAEESLVEITAYNPVNDYEGKATGYIFATDGPMAFVVTYAPFIEFEGEFADRIEARVKRAGAYKATLVGYDYDRLVAVMSICCDDGFTALEQEASGNPRTGTQAVAVGYSIRRGRSPADCVVLPCTIAMSARIQSLEPDWRGMFYHDANLSSGYFGGPLVSTEGRVLGVNVGISAYGFFHTVSNTALNELLSEWTGE